MSYEELRHIYMLMIELREGAATERQKDIADEAAAITKIYLDKAGSYRAAVDITTTEVTS
jgi:hypothetical protein